MFFGILLTLASTGLIAPQASAMLYDRQGQVLPAEKLTSSDVAWSTVGSPSDFSGVGVLAKAPRGAHPTLEQLLSLGSAEDENLDDDAPAMYCTATLIETGARAAAPAYVLTNGHCYGGELLAANGKIENSRPPADVYFLLNMNSGAASASTVRRVRVKRVVYATMAETDVAVLELDATLASLVTLGYRPIALDPVAPAIDMPVTLVGVPMDEMPAAGRVLHESRCQLGARVTVEQVRYERNETDWVPVTYHWARSYRHSCSMVGGNSGSPMISNATGRIVGVNNGAVEENCFPNCRELDDEGQPRLHVANTAQSVADFARRFDSRGRFKIPL